MKRQWLGVLPQASVTLPGIRQSFTWRKPQGLDQDMVVPIITARE